MASRTAESDVSAVSSSSSAANASNDHASHPATPDPTYASLSRTARPAQHGLFRQPHNVLGTQMRPNADDDEHSSGIQAPGGSLLEMRPLHNRREAQCSANRNPADAPVADMQVQAVHGQDEQAQQDARDPPRFHFFLVRDIVRRWRALPCLVRVCILLAIASCVFWVVASRLWHSYLGQKS